VVCGPEDIGRRGGERLACGVAESDSPHRYNRYGDSRQVSTRGWAFQYAVGPAGEYLGTCPGSPPFTVAPCGCCFATIQASVCWLYSNTRVASSFDSPPSSWGCCCFWRGIRGIVCCGCFALGAGCTDTIFGVVRRFNVVNASVINSRCCVCFAC